MVPLNSTDLVGWDPDFAFADWLGSKTWCGYVVQLATVLHHSLFRIQLSRSNHGLKMVIGS